MLEVPEGDLVEDVGQGTEAVAGFDGCVLEEVLGRHLAQFTKAWR